MPKCKIAVFMCATILVFWPSYGRAEQSIDCPSEPTDMTIQYGNFLSGTNCTISPSGDTDTFRFVAAVGEKIIVQVTDRYGQAGGPAACVTLFGPNGEPTSKGARVCNDVTASITQTIATAGVHTILVQEAGFRGLSYSVSLQCLAGMCSSLGLSITTSSVPTLQVGQPSSFKFDALGQPPYNWSLASGTLPPGMTLRSDGTLGGTPTQAGQFTFLIRVQDSSGITATKTFTFVVAMPTPGQVLPTGLVSRWLADGNANDTQNLNNGQLQNGTTFAPGKIGQAFSFDGVDDVVLVPHSSSLNLASGHTIAAWGYRTSSSASHLVGKRVGCGFDIDFIQLAIGTGAIPSAAVPLNTWSHLATTHSASGDSHYVNGVLVASSSRVSGNNNTAPLLIGRSGTCAPFAGLIDDVQ